MDENVAFILDSTKESMENSLSHLEKELMKIRAGKANPMMLAGVRVEYYGALTPLNQVASVSAPEPRMLVIQPFDKSALKAIEKGIIEANLGFNPSNDGAIIRVPVPQLTEERRKGLVKQAKAEGENAKISLRNARRDANSELKALKDEGVSEDAIKGGEEEVNKLTKNFEGKIDSLMNAKEDEIMTI